MAPLLHMMLNPCLVPISIPIGQLDFLHETIFADAEIQVLEIPARRANQQPNWILGSKTIPCFNANKKLALDSWESGHTRLKLKALLESASLSKHERPCLAYGLPPTTVRGGFQNIVI